MKYLVCAIINLSLLAALAACSTPDEKKTAFYEKGKALYEKQDYGRARLEFKNAVQIDPKFADGYYMLGMVALKEQQFKQAYQYLVKATKLDPDHVKARVEYGRMLLAGKAPDRAMEAAEKVLARHPDHADALILKGSVLLYEKQPDAAIVLFNQLLAGGDTRPSIYLYLASAYAGKNAKEDVETVLRQGVRENPDNAALYLALAGHYEKYRQSRQAEAMIRKVVELEPDQVRHRFRLANHLWENGQKAQAEALLSDISLTGKEPETGALAVARFYIAKKSYAQAEQVLVNSIKAQGTAFEPRFLLAELYINTHAPKKAVDVLKQCLTLDDDPGTPKILNTKTALAKVYLQAGQVDAAEQLADAVLVENPNSMDAMFVQRERCCSAGEISQTPFPDSGPW